uniref:Uncharacterized protein n=1 Tax=Arundo donax TaxID=35708 RepID=A0A0A9ETA2_ARUDO
MQLQSTIDPHIDISNPRQFISLFVKNLQIKMPCALSDSHTLE